MQEREATGVRLPFADRQEAGRLLGRALAARPERADAIVLAIPRGGVPVAAAMASGLGLPLDVLVAHKLGAPSDPEVAIGAVAADGTIRIEAWARELVGRDEAYLERAAEDEIARARAREAAIRGARPRPDLAGRTVILVDDGIATGATMHVGVLAARAAGARRVLCAIPVGAAESVAALARIADDLIVLATPSPFHAVGEWYVRFDQVADEDVTRLLAAAVGRDRRRG